jgi:hypothetical protein
MKRWDHRPIDSSRERWVLTDDGKTVLRIIRYAGRFNGDWVIRLASSLENKAFMPGEMSAEDAMKIAETVARMGV